MKKVKFISFLMIIASSLLFIQCTSDPIPGPAGADGVDGVSTGPGSSATELLAKKTFLGPEVDGIVDASWADVQSLTGTAEVPDPGDNLFQGYVGNTSEVVLKAQYDDEYIYFLAQWKDNRLDLNRATWYFDSTTSLWKQESKSPTFDNTGDITRQPFNEDKFALQWDINNSTTGWADNTCYATCHTGLSEANGFAKHYTIAAGESTDMWHWKSVRTEPNGQFDDKYVNEEQPDGRQGDAKISGGYKNNKVELALDGTGDLVSVPKYYIPGREYYYWITQNEIDAGTAREIVAVATDGKLTDEDGNIIDPAAEVRYQRDGETTGSLCMPSIHTSAFIGSRGDILSASTYTGNGWVLEFKRKLNTGNSDDVVFDSVSDYPFGYATFDNTSTAHGIKAFMTLKFEQ